MILFLCLLLQRARRQRGNLFVKQLLGPSPHRRVLPVVEGEQRGQEVIYFCFVSITHVVLRRVGGNLRLKASDASLGKREGRWSIEITESAGPEERPSTGTVGLSNVVATV